MLENISKATDIYEAALEALVELPAYTGRINMVDYIGLLKKEVVPAEGCTEPVAVAFAVSLAAEQLGADATDVRLKLSANIIKNALGVGIPGTGMVGIEIAAALGAVVKQSEKRLEVLQGF